MPVEIGQGVLNLTASFAGLQRDLERQINGVDTRRAGSSAGEDYNTGFSGAAKKLTGILAGAFAAVKIGDFAKGAIDQASDLNEVGTKLQAVFGDASSDIEEFGKTGAKALGQSNLAAKNAAAGFGVFGKAAGLSSKDNAAFSTSLAGLATDMASFSNTSVEQATEALSAGLRGETEPLRAYGVLLDDASLRNEALAQGLITTTKDALTPQQKVLAANALIFKQTADAQGDFARTSGGLANQQRILSAQFEDLKGKMGAAFLPVVTGTVTALNERLFPALESLGTKAGAAWAILANGDFQGAGKGLGEEDSPLVDALFKAHELSLKVVPFLQEAWSILAHGDFKGGLGLQEDSPLVDLMFKVRDFGLETFEKLSGVWDTLKATAIELWEPIKQIASSLFDAFQTVSGSGLTAWDLLLDAFQGIADLLQATLVPAFTWLAGFMRDNPEVVLTLVGALVAWKTTMLLISVATKAWAVAQAALNIVLDANPISLIIIALAALAAGLVWAYNNVDWFREAVDTAWAWIQQAFDAAVQWIGPVMDQIGQFFVDLWNKAQPVFDFFKRSFDNFMEVIGGVIDVIAGVFTGDWSRVWDGIKGIFGGIWDQIQNIVSTAWDFIQSIGSKILEWFGALGGWVWDKITSFAADMLGHGVEFIGWLGQGIIDGAIAIWNWFTSLPGWIWDKVVVAAGYVTDRGKEFIGWIRDGIVAGATGIWDFVTGLPGKIWELLVGLKDKILQLGKDFVGWIVEGIKSVATSIWDAITGAFDGGDTASVVSGDQPGVVFGGSSRGGVVGGFAAGGVVPGRDPGRRDNVLARLPNGQAWGLRSEESVFVPEFTRAIGGASTVDAWNRLAEQGKLGDIGIGMGFASGGVVGTKGAAFKFGAELANKTKDKVIEELKKPVTYGVAEGTRGAFMQAVASQMGLEYVWGGASPPTFDCSGLMSWAMQAAGAGIGRLTAAEFGDRFPRVSPEKPGDMAIFDTGRVSPKAGHIGMVLDPAAKTMMHTDGAGPSRISDYASRGGLMGFIDPIGGEYKPSMPEGGSKTSKLVQAIVAKLRTKLHMASGSNAVGSSGDGTMFDPSGGVEQWRGLAMQSLAEVGAWKGMDLTYAIGKLLYQMQTESGGDPNAINTWDKNYPLYGGSQGLLQTIIPTFQNALRGTPWENLTGLGPYNPRANIIASILYGLNQYGSLDRAYRGVAYANGGIVPGLPSKGDSVPALLTPGEGVFTQQQTKALLVHARDLEAGFSGRSPAVNIEHIELGRGGVDDLTDALAWAHVQGRFG